MFGADHYVPILKAKQAEMLALRDSKSSVKAGITPLIEMVPIPWDFEKERPSKTLTKHVQDRIESLKKAWKGGRPLFVDMKWVEDAVDEEGTWAIPIWFSELQKSELAVIPVLSLEGGAQLRAAIKAAGDL